MTSVIPASLVAPDRGKTFVLTYATIYRALHSPNSRHAIFRLTAELLVLLLRAKLGLDHVQ